MIDSRPMFLEGERRVHAAVVEFDALADAVGAAAQDDHLLAVLGSVFRFPLPRTTNNNTACTPRIPRHRCPPACTQWRTPRSRRKSADFILGQTGLNSASWTSEKPSRLSLSTADQARSSFSGFGSRSDRNRPAKSAIESRLPLDKLSGNGAETRGRWRSGRGLPPGWRTLALKAAAAR